MSSVKIHRNHYSPILVPDCSDFEVVERKFRGHPDSLADMVAHSFVQKYIHAAWEKFPKLRSNFFPNFSNDKIVLSGASTKFGGDKYKVLKPIDALLVGKITPRIGSINIDIDAIFKDSLETVLTKCLGHEDYKPHVERKIYSVSLSGADHHKSFYLPDSEEELINVLKEETNANDTVYTVAYSPLSVTEKLSIYLDTITASEFFKDKFKEIGSDIKCMIRRRSPDFEITMCLPIFPEKVHTDQVYNSVIGNAKEYLYDEILKFLSNFSETFKKPTVTLSVNTKDTNKRKYYLVWGTALSKGDIGAVGRGNRPQGFISGIRPSANEAIFGKNPNHFPGVLNHLIAEKISKTIYDVLELKNIVYVASNIGDAISNPNSIDIVLERDSKFKQRDINGIVTNALAMVPEYRKQFISEDPYERFMRLP